MDAPGVANTTDFILEPTSLYGPGGEEIVAVVKSTWVLGPSRSKRPPVLELAPAALRRGVRFADVPWGDPATSSVRYPADLAIDKAGTDVVIVADACAPNGEAAAHIDVKASVGPLEVLLRAHGPRTWLSGGSAPSASKEVTRVPLRWDLAFGGREEIRLGEYIEDARNPSGLGIADDVAKLEGHPAPQVESLTAPIAAASDRPTPAGVGAIARHWLPRRKYAGTYDLAWHDDRAPRPPIDQDPRYALFAAPGLHAKTPLAGGEAVVLVNMSPHLSVLRFELPRVKLELAFELRGEIVHQVVAPIDTVLIDLTNEDDDPMVIVELVHRARLMAPRRKRDLIVRARELLIDIFDAPTVVP